MMWDIVPIAASAEHLTQMTVALRPSLTKASVDVQWEKATYWSLDRPAAITVADQRLQAEDGSKPLGLSAAAGGDPELNSRMTVG